MAATVAVSAARNRRTGRNHRTDDERDGEKDDGFFGGQAAHEGDGGMFAAAQQDREDSQTMVYAKQMMASQLKHNPGLVSEVKDAEARKFLMEASNFSSKPTAKSSVSGQNQVVNLPISGDDTNDDPDYTLTRDQQVNVTRGGRIQAWREDMSPAEQARLDLAIQGKLPRTANGSGSGEKRRRRSSAADALMQATNKQRGSNANLLGSEALAAGSASRSQRHISESKVGPQASRRFSKREGDGTTDGDDPGVVLRGGQVKYLDGYEESPCVIPQNHPFMKIWDVVMLALLIFTAVVTPFEVAFLASTEYDAMFFVNVVVSILFLSDLIINFFLPYIDKKTGVEVDDNVDIAYSYLTGWFMLDFLSIFPFDIIAAETGGEETAGRLRIIRTIRLLKLAKLLRILRANRIFTRWRNMIGLTYSMVQLLQFLVVIMVLAHWSACMFYLWSSIFQDDYDTSYIADAGLSESRPWTAYIVSLYWATATISTIGYGDVNPVNTAERGLGVILMLIGGGVYAYTVGAVYGLISTYDGATIEYRRMLDNLNMYTKEYKLPPDLKQDLRDYFGHCQKLMRAQFYRDLLRQMSPELRGRVASYLHKPWISHIPFFNVDKPSENKAFITAVAMHLEAAVFARKEHVVKQNETLTKMVIIQKGLATRWDTGAFIRRGAFFGEEMIMSRARATTTFQAITFLDVYFLTKKSLQRILESGDFEKTRQKIRFAIIRLALRREMKLAIAFVKLQNRMMHMNPRVTNVPGASDAIERHAGGSSVDGSDEKTHTSKDTSAAAGTPAGGRIGSNISEISDVQLEGGKLVASQSIRLAREQQDEADAMQDMPALTNYLLNKGLVDEEFVEMRRRHSLAATSKLWRRPSKEDDEDDRKAAKERSKAAAEREARDNPAYREMIESSTPIGGSSPQRRHKRHGSLIVQTRDPLLPGMTHPADVEASEARQRWSNQNGGSEGPSSAHVGADGRTVLAKAKSHHKVPFSHVASREASPGNPRRRSTSRLVHRMHTAQEASTEDDRSPRRHFQQPKTTSVHQGSVLERGAARDSDSDDDDSMVQGGIGQVRPPRDSPTEVSLGLHTKPRHADLPVVAGKPHGMVQLELPGTPGITLAQAGEGDDQPPALPARRDESDGVHIFDAANDVSGEEPRSSVSKENTKNRDDIKQRYAAPVEEQQADIPGLAKERKATRKHMRVVAVGVPDSGSDTDASTPPAGLNVSVGGEVLDQSVSNRKLASSAKNDSGSGLEIARPSPTRSKRSEAPSPMVKQPKPKGGRRMSRAGLIESDAQLALKRTHSTSQVTGHDPYEAIKVRRAFNEIKRKMNPLAREMWRHKLIQDYKMDPDDASRVVEDPSQREMVTYTKEGRRVILDNHPVTTQVGLVQGGFKPSQAVSRKIVVSARRDAGSSSGEAVQLERGRTMSSSYDETVRNFRPSDADGFITPHLQTGHAKLKLLPELAAQGIQERYAVLPSAAASKQFEELAQRTATIQERLRQMANSNTTLQRQNSKMEQSIYCILALVERNNLQALQLQSRMWSGLIGIAIIAALIVSMATATLVFVLNQA